MVQRAEKAGFEAMVVTIDAQYVGNRRVSRRNPLNLPEHMKIPNASPDVKEAVDLFALHDEMDKAVTWEAIKWLKTYVCLA